MIIELKYGNTNTYLIKGTEKYILFDTDWAGTFERFCQAIKNIGIQIQDIEYLFLSHFHPDHMGIAGQLPLHEGTQIADTWNKLLKMRPNKICYGHAKTAILEE